MKIEVPANYTGRDRRELPEKPVEERVKELETRLVGLSGRLKVAEQKIG